MRVSIIVPVYNVEQYLPRCLESLASQTYDDFEVILIDDGSTDGSGSICDSYASACGEAWRVIHKQNGGLSDARNAGIDVARGEYLLFVDSDDYVHPYLVERTISLADAYDADIVEFECVRVPDGKPFKWSDLQNSSSECWRDDEKLVHVLGNIHSAAMTWSKLFHASLFDDIRFPVGKLHEDEYTTPFLAEKADAYVKTSDVLYAYVQRRGSIMDRGYTRKRLLDIMEAYKNRHEYFHEKYDGKFDALTGYSYMWACRRVMRFGKPHFSKAELMLVVSDYRDILDCLAQCEKTNMSIPRRVKLRLFRVI